MKLRVLWVTPVVTYDASLHLSMDVTGSGGWISSMSSLLSQRSVDLHILTIIEAPREPSVQLNNITYHFVDGRGSIFKDNPSIRNRIARVVEFINPNIIDIQGVEFHYAKYIPGVSGSAKCVATLQGIISQIFRHYRGGISISEELKSRTLRDNIFFDGISERKRKYFKRGLSEQATLKNVEYYIGRTFWDKAHSLSINPNAKYFHCQRVIRSEFFDESWDLNSCKKFSIFISQGHAPFKGLHQVIKAIALLRPAFPRISVNIAGRNKQGKSLKEKLAFTGYDKYLKGLIDELDLRSCIQFIGPQDAGGMAREMASSHVFVLPSFVENSPNSLGEAQVIGVPCIAAAVGGIPGMIEHGVSGFLYNPYDFPVLSSLISTIFSCKNTSLRLSNGGLCSSAARYEKTEDVGRLLEIYSSLLNDG